MGIKYQIPSLHPAHKTMVLGLSLLTSPVCFQQQADPGCSGQEGIMPLFLFRSAIVRRLWLDTWLLLASFLRRSSTVSRVWPCPLGLPTTLLERSGLKLEGREENVLTGNICSSKEIFLCHHVDSRGKKLGTVYSQRCRPDDSRPLTDKSFSKWNFEFTPSFAAWQLF